MKSLLLLISLFNQPATQPSSDSLPLKHRVYKTKIFLNDTQSKYGYLTAITDSSLAISHVPFRLGTLGLQDGEVTKYVYQDISYVQLRRKGNIGRYMVVGTLVGATVGVILASNVPRHQDPVGQVFDDIFLPPRLVAATGGIFGGLGGAAIGAIIGAIVKKKFIIGGKKEKFDVMRTSMLDKVYGKH